MPERFVIIEEIQWKRGIWSNMRIRSSENPHNFQSKLFEEIGAYCLQGLLMDDDHNFTAAVEAVEYQDGDDLTTLPFWKSEVYARFILAKSIGVPFYIVCYMNNMYIILHAVTRDGRYYLRREAELDEDGFVSWWGRLKRTVQTKQLDNGGEDRLAKTVFDRILRKYGYEWGGNIDGFVLTEDRSRIRYIIDNISVSKAGLQDDPAIYFHSVNPKHGPRYEGWYAAVKLAHTLNVPHLLFTIDKQDQDREHIGLAVIDRLTPDGIFYADATPDKNVIEGLDNIMRAVNLEANSAKAPLLVEKPVWADNLQNAYG